MKDGASWAALSTPGYCWYNNDVATNKATYGALYNWYTVNTGKLCPTAWHVPTDVEWTILTTYLGGENIAGGKLKATILWASHNTGSNNSSGFTALPGGSRNSNGAFVNIGYTSIWWSHTETTETTIGNDIFRYMNDNSSNVVRGDYGKQDGFSVRCIKEN